jgi:uncharacterized protein (DUF885 family)
MASTPASDVESRFDRTVDRWFRERMALDPVMATSFGLHEHDAELPDGSREQIERRVAELRSSVTEMERFAPQDLSADRALDRDLLIHEARLELYDLEEQRSWAGRSDGAEALGRALFPLFTRHFAPFPTRLDAIAGRLEAAPRFLAEARSRVVAPVQLWAELDLEATLAMPEFLDSILAAAGAEHAEASLLARIDGGVRDAKAALVQHAEWLRRDVLPRAEADWRVGPDGFEQLLALRALEADGDQILAIGESMLAEATAARDALCAEIDPTIPPADVGDQIKADHPATFAEVLEEYRASMARARTFVVEHDLVTFPGHDQIVVLVTPSYERHLTPFAAYYDPAAFDPDPVGTYLVTPPETPAMMREHSYASISNTSVHEAYPGHHLQLAVAMGNSSRIRLLAQSATEYIEGWAFYAERMMKEAGFDDAPANRYIFQTDIVWRACRIILDVKLQRGQIGLDDAVSFMVEQTGFERSAAVDEVNWYTCAPTYPLSYLYGRHMIEQLRADVARRMGPAFSLKFFHDTFIYGGTMPVSFTRRLFENRLDGLAR